MKMLSIKILDAVPLPNLEVLVFFEDGKVKKFDVKRLFDDWPEYRRLEDSKSFKRLRVEPGGYGISWDGELDCSEGELYENGVDIPLRLEDFRAFSENNLVSTREATNILGCSKQNVDDLVRRGKLHPIKKDGRYNLFLRCEVVARSWAKRRPAEYGAGKDGCLVAAEPSPAYGPE